MNDISRQGRGVAEQCSLSEEAVLPTVDRRGMSGLLPEYRIIAPGLAIAPSVSVVIPARNEARYLGHVFASIPSWVDEIVLVDGHSLDDTVSVACQLCPNLKVVAQQGHGKGDALLAGFEVCQGEIIVMLDADGSSDGAEITRFVGTLVAGADFVKGSRFANDGKSDDITLTRRFGNWMLITLVNRLFGTRYTDFCYGYNAFWARHLSSLNLDCNGFEVETVLSIRAARAGLRVHEIPSYEHARVHGVSNLRILRDGWRIAKVIMRERFPGSKHPQSKGAGESAPEIPAVPLVAAHAIEGSLDHG
jgi:glycosyltransferase involved in cell wall biosynthesis